MGQLDDATRAYRAAQAALKRAEESAQERVRAARQRADQARLALATAIVEEARAGTPQKEIVRISGYSRENVRTILRANGVEPD